MRRLWAWLVADSPEIWFAVSEWKGWTWLSLAVALSLLIFAIAGFNTSPRWEFFR